MATDVSEVCIQRNRARDGEFISGLGNNGDEFRYEQLDILSTAASTVNSQYSKYDIIIDKGCLDTFLFRNVRGARSTERHPPLIASLLKNVHSMLRSGSAGKYIIISPRKRLASVKQFVGFKSVERVKIDSGSGILDGRQEGNTSANDNTAYMHICQKNEECDIQCASSSTSLFFDTHGILLLDDDSICTGCGVSFEQYRGGESLSGRGEVFWKRKWKGHQAHCR